LVTVLAQIEKAMDDQAARLLRSPLLLVPLAEGDAVWRWLIKAQTSLETSDKTGAVDAVKAAQKERESGLLDPEADRSADRYVDLFRAGTGNWEDCAELVESLAYQPVPEIPPKEDSLLFGLAARLVVGSSCAQRNADTYLWFEALGQAEQILSKLESLAGSVARAKSEYYLRLRSGLRALIADIRVVVPSEAVGSASFTIPVYGTIRASFKGKKPIGGAEIGKISVREDEPYISKCYMDGDPLQIRFLSGLSRLVPERDYVALHVAGDSMDKAGIEEGDVVILERGSPTSMDIVAVAFLDVDLTFTLKRFFIEKDSTGKSLAVEFQPVSSNAYHKARRMTAKEIAAHAEPPFRVDYIAKAVLKKPVEARA
jgi:hypothetical protein